MPGAIDCLLLCSNKFVCASDEYNLCRVIEYGRNTAAIAVYKIKIALPIYGVDTREKAICSKILQVEFSFFLGNLGQPYVYLGNDRLQLLESQKPPTALR